ncbi:MAG TPA: DUF6701 domain-containing protein [Albitalea sp.]|uniref:DUF6701 domain-containing protein n=1 Tax=Piscinibacter sp. TaxID=1903157 RepID=UPI002ED35137
MSTRWLLRLLLAWLCFAGSAVHAQTYTADSSAAVAAAYPWIDIAATGTQLALADDQVSGAINLGFTFTFGSTAYTQVRVGSNGMVHFGGTTTAYTNSALPLTGSGGEPNIDAVMLPLWDDFQPDGTGTYIRYRSSGTAPNRVFVVSWLAVPYYCWNARGTNCDKDSQTITTSALFQVQIHEQGQFVYRYGAVDAAGGAHTTAATYSNPAGATIGYELTDTDYVQFAFHSAAVAANTTILWSKASAAPGGFNAFDIGTAAGSITGSIHTKVAASAFSVAVVALNTTKTAVATGFTGDVKVELLNAADNSGALNASTGCRSTWTTAIATATLNFAAGDAGRDNIAFTENNAWRDVRVRMSWPATGTATVVACSTDDFAIRPSAFAGFTATDADWQSAGTGRSLANSAATGGVVHKAGRPFTVSATAVNAAAGVTSNYNGTPTATVSACAGTGCSTGFGALSLSMAATAGVINDTGATYSEVGAFTLQLNDASFAAVDASDGSSVAELTIGSPALIVGRFVPDHFDLALLVTPQLKTFNTTACAARSFTYVGQPFGYVTPPQATVLARNAAGATTTQYRGSLWKLAAAGVTQAYSPLAPASPGLDASGIGLPGVTSNDNGTGVIAGAAADTLSVVRSSTTPLAPFNAAFTLAWSVTDSAEAAVTGNGSIPTASAFSFANIAFDAGNTFRWGVLKLASAYGSELNQLAVPVEVQHWNGVSFVTNTADQCTAVPTGSVVMGNWQRNLAACETAITPATLTLASGRGFFTLRRPGNGNNGSVDLSVQLNAAIAAGEQTCSVVGGAAVAATAANLPWLRGKWAGSANYDRNPSGRASFGQYRSPLIYLRESY